MAVDIRRREFIAALGSAAIWPFALRAQLGTRPTIGLVGGATAAAQANWTAAFVQRLREKGWIEKETVAIEYRWLEGRSERAPAIFEELVRLKVDVIVTHATPNVIAAKRVTSVIPIVFPSAGDPVANGIVNSLSRPGGNVTGLSMQSTEVFEKLVGLLRELLPNLRRVAILFNVGNPVAVLQADTVKSTARSVGLEVALAEVRSSEDLGPSIAALAGRTDALIVPSAPLYNTNRVQLNSFALQARLPTIYYDRVYVESGGLMSYGPNWTDMWRRAAEIVDRILHGANAADIPVEQPTTFSFVLNLKTAKALGLTPSRFLRASAEELIE